MCKFGTHFDFHRVRAKFNLIFSLFKIKCQLPILYNSERDGNVICWLASIKIILIVVLDFVA
jgi:hypothetical protein